MCTGIRIVRALSASARATAWRIHHVAYGRELVAAAPVELLDRPDQAERPFLDQVEERQPLVAVVLRDRDDEAQIRLDHPLLRLHVAALDLLRELDLLRRRQQLVPAGLAQEELQRVRRRLDRRRRWRGRWRLLDFLRVVDDLDAARLELAVEEVEVEDVELVHFREVVQLGLPRVARRLARLEQQQDVFVLEDGLDFDRHQGLRARLPVIAVNRNTFLTFALCSTDQASVVYLTQNEVWSAPAAPQEMSIGQRPGVVRVPIIHVHETRPACARCE